MKASDDSPLVVVLIAAGLDCQISAGFAAATFASVLEPKGGVRVYVPEGEEVSGVLERMTESYGIELRPIELEALDNRHRTARLKVEGWLRTAKELGEEELALWVDADTVCERPFRLPQGITARLRQGDLGAVPDIKDRSATTAGGPWKPPEGDRGRYINAGVLFGSRASLPVFEEVDRLAIEQRWLEWEGCNDQHLLNYVLGDKFKGRLIVLDRAFNVIRSQDGEAAILSHFAGSRRWYGRGRRKRDAHLKRCYEVLCAYGDGVQAVGL